MKRFLTLFASVAATLMTAVAAPITMLEVPDSTKLLDASDPFGFGLGFTYNGVFYAYTNQPVIVGGIGVEADPVAWPYATNAIPKQATITINGETKELGSAPVFTITAEPIETDMKFATNTVCIVRDGVVKGVYGTNLYAAAAAAVSGDKITLGAGDYHIYQRGIVLADGVSMSGAGSGVSRIIETGMDATLVGGSISQSVVRVGSDSVIENVGVICDWSVFGDTRFILGIGAFVETNVTIRNCYIRGASDAVYLKGTRNVDVSWCDIETAFDGVMFFTDTDTGIGSNGRLSWSRVKATALWPTNDIYPDVGCAASSVANGSTGIVSFCDLSATGGDLQNIGFLVSSGNGHGEIYNSSVFVQDAGKTGEGWISNTFDLQSQGGYLYEYGNKYATDSGLVAHGAYRLDNAYFDTNATPVFAQGVMGWDGANRTFSFGLGNGVVGQAFMESHIPVVNQTGETITNGQVVCYGGAIGNSGQAKAVKFVSDGSVRNSCIFGVATETMPNGAAGKVTSFGYVNGIPTDGAMYGEVWTNGAIVYASTNIAGGLTINEPQAPYHRNIIGIIVSAHQNNGTLQVQISRGVNLTDIDDVDGTPLTATGQFPMWDNTRKVFDFNANFVAGTNAVSQYAQALVSGLLGSVNNWQNTNFFVGPVIITNASVAANTAPLVVRNMNAYASPFTQRSQVWQDSTGAEVAYMRTDGAFVCSARSVQGSGLLSSTAGSASSVSIGYSQANSGFYFPSVSTMGLAVNATPRLTFLANNTVISNTPLYVANNAAVSNLTFHVPRWVDEKITGGSVSANPSAAPSRVEAGGTGSGVYGIGWSIGDDASFVLQLAHGMAETNSFFPNFYYGPHIHVSSTATAGGADKATFVMKWQIGALNDSYNGTLARTNTVTFAAANTHYVLDFGVVTNNALQGRDSVIARGTLYRIAGTDDVGADVAIMDSLDFHIPVREYGSANINGDTP